MIITKNSTRQIIALRNVATGQWLRIHSLPPGVLRAQFIRFGMSEGDRVKCVERLPGGTVVIQKNRQQLTIGHLLARRIFVFVLYTNESE